MALWSSPTSPIARSVGDAPSTIDTPLEFPQTPLKHPVSHRERHSNVVLVWGGLTATTTNRAGASHTMPSGLEGEGESARQLARRLRCYGVLRAFQQYELAHGNPLPDDEIEL